MVSKKIIAFILGMSICLGVTAQVFVCYLMSFVIRRKAVFIVGINSFGEALWETMLMLVGMFCLIYYMMLEYGSKKDT